MERVRFNLCFESNTIVYIVIIRMEGEYVIRQ